MPAKSHSRRDRRGVRSAWQRGLPGWRSVGPCPGHLAGVAPLVPHASGSHGALAVRVPSSPLERYGPGEPPAWLAPSPPSERRRAVGLPGRAASGRLAESPQGSCLGRAAEFREPIGTAQVNSYVDPVRVHRRREPLCRQRPPHLGPERSSVLATVRCAPTAPDDLWPRGGNLTRPPPPGRRPRPVQAH